MTWKAVGIFAGLAAILLSAHLLAQEPTRSVWDGVYTQEQADRGRSSYNTECSTCHGTSMNGGESAPPLAGGEFLSNWNGLTVGDLFERIRTTMPMNQPGKLSRETITDVVAYILSANNFPAGKTGLDRRTEFMKQIRIDAVKPEKGSSR